MGIVVARRGAELSTTELRVLSAASSGLTSLEMADQFRRSVDTIKSQRRSVLAKLGARSTAQAVALAYESGILEGQRRHRGSPREVST